MAKLEVIAQDLDIFEKNNPFAQTGKISCYHIFNAGASGILIGHSETGDNASVKNKKIKAIIDFQKRYHNSLQNNAVVVGEAWEEYNEKSHDEIAILNKQKCHEIFNEIPNEFLKKCTLIYEPKWGSQGSGREDQPPPSPKLISTVLGKTKDFLIEKLGTESAKKVPLLYGGRSTPERTAVILKDPVVHGLILGSACNTINKTLAILDSIKENSIRKSKMVICNFKAYELVDSYKDYVVNLSNISDDFIIHLAPSFTDIRQLSMILQK